MIRGLLMVGAGVAAVGIARFVSAAIAEERQRRTELHDTHEAHRWEGEGGNVVSPQSASGAGSLAGV